MRKPPHSFRDQAGFPVLHVLGAGIALSLLGDGTMMTVLPQAAFASELALTINMVAWALAVNRLVRLGFNPLAGRLLRVLPRRIVLIPSLALGAVSTLLCSFGGFPLVMAGRILWGLAWAGLWVGGTAVVLDLSQDHTRGRHSGLFQMWFFIGVGLSSFMGAWLSDIVGLKVSLRFSAFIMALVSCFWFWALPETGRSEQRSQLPAGSLGDKAVRRSVVLAAVPMFVNRFLFAGVLAVTVILWLETFIGQGVQVGGAFVALATLAGAFSASRTLISLASTTLTGRISDRLGARWPVLAAVVGLGAIGCAMMGTPWFPLGIAGLLLSSLTSGGIQTLLTAWVGDRVPEEAQETVLGALFSIGDVGSTLGPLAGLAWVQRASIGGLYQAAALLLALTAGYALWVAVRDVPNEALA